MNPVLAVVLFAGFVAGAILSGWVSHRGIDRKLYFRWFLLYVTIAMLLPGFLHRDAWPFSRWQLFAYQAADPVRQLVIRGGGEGGAEYDIDERAWEPLSYLELYSWVAARWNLLSDAERKSAAEFLLSRAEEARKRSRAGGAVGQFGRWLGPLATPLHIVPRRAWLDAAGTPPEALVSLRIYRDTWRIVERARDPGAWRRELVWEGP